MIAATVILTDGEEVTGLMLFGHELLHWDRSDPHIDPVGAVLHETEATTVVHTYRRLAGWLADRNHAVWAHLHDALDEIGMSLVPVGDPQPTGPAQPSPGRPSPSPRPGWFVD